MNYGTYYKNIAVVMFKNDFSSIKKNISELESMQLKTTISIGFFEIT